MQDQTLHFTLDNGNSNPHFGEFQNNKLKEVYSYENFLKNYSPQDFNHNNIKIAVSNVSSLGPELNSMEKNLVRFNKSFGEGQFRDMRTNYSQTIGEDRLYQSYYLYKNLISAKLQKILLIDAGTFMTCDFIDQNGHLGGHITPGLGLMSQAYQKGTNLAPPEINELASESFHIPTDTQSAISSGLSLMIHSFFNEIISNFRPDHIVITGGNSSQISKLNLAVENENQVTIEDHLIHKALNFLLTEGKS